MVITNEILLKAKKKASQSGCKFKISAIGLNSRGEAVISKVNRSRFAKKGGGIHAEMAVMTKARKMGIKTIIVCRVGRDGKFLPIDACAACSKKAAELGIKIITVAEDPND